MMLIIDSEKKSESQKKQYFIESGFDHVVVAKSAESARVILHSPIESQLSLIIIDGELDDVDSFSFCREIRKIDGLKYTYILMMVSSSNNKSAIKKARQSGATLFSVKPYGSEEFQKNFSQYFSSKVVVLVDDDPVIRIMIKKILLKKNIEIIELDDGVEANNLLNKMLPPRLVLMDIGLPNINGIQLVEKINCKPGWRKTSIVMITGSSDAIDVKKCLVAGARDYITKPIVPDDFLKRLSSFLSDE